MSKGSFKYQLKHASRFRRQRAQKHARYLAFLRSGGRERTARRMNDAATERALDLEYLAALDEQGLR